MVSITYNNHVTEVPTGKVATLPCKGKVMKSDIAISADTFAILTCNGVDTLIEEGKTASMPCCGQIMKGDVSVNTKRCLIIVYDTDDSTVLGEFTMVPECTVSIVEKANHSVTLSFAGSDGEQKTAVYQSYSSAVLDGVSESNYYQTRYKSGDSFSLSGNATHRISLRTMNFSMGENTILFLGLEYVDGVPCYAPIPAITWEEWVTYQLGSYTVNYINAKIIDGYVYSRDGKKILYTSDGNRVKSTDLVESNYTQYTFAEVTT